MPTTQPPDPPLTPVAPQRRSRRRTTVATTAVAAALLTAPGLPGAAAAAPARSTLCVGSGVDCFPTLDAALRASRDGDVIRLAPGTFHGGATITTSVTLIGAGSTRTTISGGGPVLTIGVAEAAAQPTVSIRGVTITGGVTDSGPFPDFAHVIALGGGVEIPFSTGGTLGATVTITDSVITGNQVTPSATAPIGPPCPGGPCPFALAQGGGIDNWGTLTLERTTVSKNSVGGPHVSDAVGAGIHSTNGALVIKDSTIDGNRADALIPDGRFAEGGGIMITAGSFTLTGSRVSRNSATLTSRLPVTFAGRLIDMNAHAGGIHVSDGIPMRVHRTEITDNTVTADDPLGEPIAFDGGMLGGDGPMTMSDTLVARNHVIARFATSTDVGPGGAALDVDGGGTVTRTRVMDNTFAITSAHGDGVVNGAFAVVSFTNDPKPVLITDSVISGNTATATTSTGSATVLGAGVFNNNLLELRHVTVSDNLARAIGPNSVALGGGIFNGDTFSGPPTLALTDSLITRNTAVAGSAQGGGLFTIAPVTLTRVKIASNRPDQCTGCSLLTTSRTHRPSGPVTRRPVLDRRQWLMSLT